MLYYIKFILCEPCRKYIIIMYDNIRVFKIYYNDILNKNVNYY